MNILEGSVSQLSLAFSAWPLATLAPALAPGQASQPAPACMPSYSEPPIM